jgi:hypothetical protein
MKSPVPFKKPRVSQYAMPPFYWRGEDALREKEYMMVEHMNALSAYHRGKSEMQGVQQLLDTATQLLQERDGYTVALADFMDGDADGFREENDLKRELFELETAITQLELDLKARVHVHNAGVAAGLRKEKAYFLIEIERETKALENADVDIENCKRTLAALAVSPRYRVGRDTEYLYARLSAKKKSLRAFVNQTKNEFDATRPALILQTQDARTQRAAMMAGVEARLVRLRCREQWERRPRKRRNFLGFMIDQIEELNTMMRRLGMEGDVVDTDPLRERAIAVTERTEPLDDSEEPAIAQDAGSSVEADPQCEEQAESQVVEAGAENREEEEEEEEPSPLETELPRSRESAEDAPEHDLQLAEAPCADGQESPDI